MVIFRKEKIGKNLGRLYLTSSQKGWISLKREISKIFLGVNIEKVDSETYHLSQTKIIDQIVSYLILSNSYATPRTTTYLTTNILRKSQDAEKSTTTFTITVS